MEHQVPGPAELGDHEAEHHQVGAPGEPPLVLRTSTMNKDLQTGSDTCGHVPIKDRAVQYSDY